MDSMLGFEFLFKSDPFCQQTLAMEQTGEHQGQFSLFVRKS